jgi:hypothetical protein
LRGRRNLDRGDETISDEVVRRALRRRGVGIVALGLALGAGVTAVLIAVALTATSAWPRDGTALAF